MPTTTLQLTSTQAAALRHSLHIHLARLAMVEDHDPDRAKAARAIEEASTLLAILDQLPQPAAAGHHHIR